MQNLPKIILLVASALLSVQPTAIASIEGKQPVTVWVDPTTGCESGESITFQDTDADGVWDKISIKRCNGAIDQFFIDESNQRTTNILEDVKKQYFLQASSKLYDESPQRRGQTGDWKDAEAKKREPSEESVPKEVASTEQGLNRQQPTERGKNEQDALNRKNEGTSQTAKESESDSSSILNIMSSEKPTDDHELSTVDSVGSFDSAANQFHTGALRIQLSKEKFEEFSELIAGIRGTETTGFPTSSILWFSSALLSFLLVIFIQWFNIARSTKLRESVDINNFLKSTSEQDETIEASAKLLDVIVTRNIAKRALKNPPRMF